MACNDISYGWQRSGYNQFLVSLDFWLATLGSIQQPYGVAEAGYFLRMLKEAGLFAGSVAG